jgi:transcriptional regulator with GAF, ATPase, and Fis domain
MQMVQDGQFRDDLFYRLNVFPIAIPPLRDRRNDILLLTWAFIKEFGQSMGKTIDKITRKDMEGLQRYAWPGNVRELRNVIERAMILARSSTLPIDLPEPSKPVNGQLSGTLAEIEKAYIVQVLGKTNWRIRGQNGAAETLGLKPTTLHSRMQKLGIRRPVNPEIP